MLTRRVFLIAGGAALAAAKNARPDEAQRALADLQVRLGGRLGVFAKDTGTRRTIGHRQDDRFAMTSTFKVALAAAVLSRVDRGEHRLGDVLRFGRDDLVPYAPVIEANLGNCTLTIEQLCAAIVQVSDNVAANLLLPLVDGPQGLTRFIRTQGDRVTRLDRREVELNTNIEGDLRDTTTPAAMTGLLERLLLGKALSPASRARLTGWMETSTTGKARLRAGLPTAWRAGDKTGTGNRAVNDVAIAWPPRRPPILIAVYVDRADRNVEGTSAAIAEVGRIVAKAFA